MPPTKPPTENKPEPRPPDVVQELKVDDLVPTKDNPRQKPDTDSIKSLAASIISLGVLQPLLARPHPTQAGKFDLRAGYRRLTAAKAAGIERVPVIVRDMDDAEAIEVTVTENLNREDLHPLDQGRAIATLLGAGWPADRVADKLGRSMGWVLRRSHLTDLHPRFVTMNTKAGHAFASVPVGVLEQLARLPQAVQAGMAKEMNLTDSWLPNWAETVGNCREYIDRNVTMTLSRAPWALGDSDLYPRAGSCNDCPKRSSCTPGLFDDIEAAKGGGGVTVQCLDVGCFNEKHRRTIKAKVAKLRADHPNLVLVTQSKPQDAAAEATYFGRPVLSSYSVKRVAKDAKGAIPAVIANGKGAGSLTYVTLPKAINGSPARAAGVAMTMAQKRKGLADRRQAWVIDRLAAIVDEHLAELDNEVRPKWLAAGLLPDHLNELAIAFMMPEADDLPAAGKAAWRRSDSYRKGADGVKQLEHDLAAALLACWRGRLVRHNQHDLKRYSLDATNVAHYLGVAMPDLVKQSHKDIPEPQAWATTAKPKVVNKRKAKAK